MGLLSGLRRAFQGGGGGFMDRALIARALSQGDYGTAMQMRSQMQQIQARQQAAQAEAEREQQAAASIIGNAANLTSPDGTPIYNKAQLGAMWPEEISRAVQDRLQLRQYAAGGGSTHDPVTGDTHTAGSRHEFQGTVFDIPEGGGPAVVRRRGYQAIPVQAGGRTEIIDSADPFGENGAATPSPAAPEQVAPADQMSEAELRERAQRAILRGAEPRAVNEELERQLRMRQGGAASQGQAPFVGRGRHHRTAMAESGGRDFGRNGQPLTSSAGARYAMQVLPSTAANPGFGVRPAASDSPAEYNRVGREYVDAMAREFGSEAAGAAAYNYGPGNMRNLMRRHPNDWRNRLPRETRNYLRRQGL